MKVPKSAIVVPTLGRRPEFLTECLESIRASGVAYVRLVAPSGYKPPPAIDALIDEIVSDPGQGLAHAINCGFQGLPLEIQYLNWLGDDDRLSPNGLAILESVLDGEPKTQLVFGGCSYIDETGRVLFVNKPGSWAKWLLAFGPQLISQPALLFRRSLFDELGGLDESLNFAFDLDLLLTAKKIGRIACVQQITASFRWHNDSLTVGSRQKSVREASKVRQRYLPMALRKLSILWEPIVRNLILVAGVLITSLVKHRAHNERQ